MTALDEHYSSLENGYQVEHDSGYEGLVVPNGNAARPVHRWFHLKESFSADLFARVLQDAGLARRRKLTVLDPYAGVGTSLVSAIEWSAEQAGRKMEAIGIEQNPFLHMVAAAKVRAVTRGGGDFMEYRTRLLRACRRRRFSPAPAPALSTFANTAYFRAGDLAELLRLKTAIDQVHGSEQSRNLARICLAASLEPVSGLRRDGRALRYEPRKARGEPIFEFERRMAQVNEDMSFLAKASKGTVIHGDGRRVTATVGQVSADLVLFSPPYPNNIDYTEVYKLENWFLGLIRSTEEFRDQRLRTVRSHPSVYFPPEYEVSENGYKSVFGRVVGPILSAIPGGRYQHQRQRVVRGYFDDMLETLTCLRPTVAPRGAVVYVVGNSAHGHGADGFVIAADVVIASLAEAAGYVVERIAVARRPKRRGVASDFIRESIVFLRNPG